MVFTEARIPYLSGKIAAHNDLKIFAPNFGSQLFTLHIMGRTASAVQKLLNQDEPSTLLDLKLELTTSKVRMNMLNELANVAKEFYPGVRFY